MDKKIITKKGQAALEFLTTYAWAFLVILIMIGALAYFGILKPTKILPDRCNFGTEIGCVDYRVTETTFDLRLKNNLGEPIVIPSVVSDQIILSAESETALTCTLNTIGGAAPPVAGNSYTWRTGEIIDISFTGCNSANVGFIEGEKAKILITVNYHLAKTSSTYLRQVQGEVFSTVTA